MIRIAFEILLIFLLTIANGIFAGSELAIVSARKVRLEQLAGRVAKMRVWPSSWRIRLAIFCPPFKSESRDWYPQWSDWRSHPLHPVGSVLLTRAPGSRLISEPLSIFIVVAVIHLSVSGNCGNWLPKRIALNNPEQIACTVARPLRGLAIVTAPPHCQAAECFHDGILKLLGIQGFSRACDYRGRNSGVDRAGNSRQGHSKSLSKKWCRGCFG